MTSKGSTQPPESDHAVPEDTSNPSPLYRQVQDSLLEQILDGCFPVGSQLPTVQDLCQGFGASRITINRALAELERDGYISRRQGKRAVIIRSSPEPGPEVTFELIRNPDYSGPSEFAWRFLSFAYKPSTAPIASKLGIQEGDPVALLERLQMVGEQAASASQHYLNLPDDTYINPGELSKQESVMDISTALGIQVSHTDLRLTAISASPEHAQLLGINEGEPLLFSEGLVYAQEGGGSPVAVECELHVGERTSLSMRVTPPPEG